MTARSVKHQRHPVFRYPAVSRQEFSMIILGIVLLIIGFVVAIPILWTIGIVVLLIGLALALLGMVGHAVGGRRHYY
jgi:predicted acyltransferase